MGTRGLLGWKVNGEYHGAYNHWDSYPEGLGMEIAQWVFEKLGVEENYKRFKDNLQKLNFIDSTKPASLEMQEKYKKFSDVSVSTQKLEEWYCLLRNIQGAGYLEAILSGELEHIEDSISFITDSLFCEYAYILNLDENVFEFYVGFQEKPIENDPFKYIRTILTSSSTNSTEYYSCALTWKCPLQESLNTMVNYIEKEKIDAEIKELEAEIEIEPEIEIEENEEKEKEKEKEKEPKPKRKLMVD